MNQIALPTRYEISRAASRVLARLEKDQTAQIAADPASWKKFRERFESHFSDLFHLYYSLYGERFDFYYHLEDLAASLAAAWFQRPQDLRALDAKREKDPKWFQSNKMLGGVIYVDLFAGDLAGVRERIPYFQELGLTYLHLMPLFKAPEGENDGGYAVSSYRDVDPKLGSMDDLARLSRDLRDAGISMVVDLVFNHTSDEHKWALEAKQGDPDSMEMYRIYPDRAMPDSYERTLREIFPDEHPGAFSPFEAKKTKQNQSIALARFSEGKGWVWTTFHKYQWDLNYANPAVFNRMAEEMLFLANQGVEVIRLDAVAFIWKQMGTSCENLPEAHTLIRAFNAVARVSSPSLLFKSEAIVHPDDVVRYIDPAECQLSYNPLLMALLWNTLATREVNLLGKALSERFHIHPGTAWVNYVRCHDDIGWTFSDDDAAILGIKGEDHRRFLNEFYRGRFPGSFSRGLPFQENPKTGDCRISGTCASLAGLEKALNEEGPDQIELAIRRVLLIHGVILTVGGIPLLYLGDEIGTLNDLDYVKDPAKANDSRWVHRPAADEENYAKRKDAKSIEGRVFGGLMKLIKIRKVNKAFAGGLLRVAETGNGQVLAFERAKDGENVLVLANFSEEPQIATLNLAARTRLHGISKAGEGSITLAPLELAVWKAKK